MLPTWIESFVVSAALARLGALQIPMLPILREREVGFILGRTQARHVVVPGTWRGVDHASMARDAATVAGIAEAALDLVVVDRALPEADAATLTPWAAVRPGPADDPLRWIFFTSGTTAEPKGVKHTDRTVAACAHRLNVRFDMRPADRNALVFPVTHIGGISWFMGGLMAGYAHILIEAFNAETSCDVLRRHGVTVAGSGPAFWMAYVAAQRRRPAEQMFPALRALVGGGAAKPPTLDAEVRAVLGVPTRHRVRLDRVPRCSRTAAYTTRTRCCSPTATRSTTPRSRSPPRTARCSARARSARSSCGVRCSSTATSTPRTTSARSTRPVVSAAATSACSTTAGCCASRGA